MVLSVLDLGTELLIFLDSADFVISTLLADRQTLVLTSQDIEYNVNTLRQLAIPLLQDIADTWGILGQPLIDNLYILINRVTALGQQLLMISPSIVNFTVADDFLPLILIGQRTNNSPTELMRLNPSIRNPNFILQGCTLRVFSRPN